MKVNKDLVRSSEKICSSTQEQSIELDYVLPDYYPEIFKIVKCFAEPKITSCIVGSDKVTYELTVCLKVIYCSEGSSKPQTVEQKLLYSKTANLDKTSGDPSVYITAVCDHINCRAVNPRRIDLRGAATISICAVGDTQTEVVSEVFGGNIQLKKKAYPCPSGIIRSQKRVLVSDDFDLGADTAPIGSIIRSSAEIISCDKKIIAGKAVAKGELKISLIYTTSGSDDGGIKCMQFSMPFSQLIELEGLDDLYDCRINTSVISCDIIPQSDGDGNADKFEAEVMLFIDCTAVRMAMYEIACDEYSTSHISSHVCTPVRLEKEPVNIDATVIIKGVCSNSDSPLAVVFEAWCVPAKLRTCVNDGRLQVMGSVILTVMGQTEGGDFVITDTEVPVEDNVDVGSGLDQRAVSPDADINTQFSVISCTYTISSENTAEVKAEIAVRGYLTDYEAVDAVTEIAIDENSPRESNDEYALRLYFAENGEELWNIAKKYGASISRVIEENELDGDVIKENTMLLIPIA